MSKALNPLSIAVGKLGNAVYYKLKYSSTGQKQGIREYVPQPANPQTTAQIDQRIKMTTVTNCYRMFGNVIRRAFEGVEYGQPSYARWSSLALGQSFAGPFMPKDWKAPAPVLGVPMSMGSLATVTVAPATNANTLKSSLVISDMGDSIGATSQNLLNANNWLQEGDQITICVISASGVPLGNVFAQSWSFYLNPDDSSTIPEVAGCDLDTFQNALCIISATNTPLCACVIVSREGSHLRSTSYWGVGSSFDQMYTRSLTDDIRNTYKRSARSKSTDWPVDPDADGGISAIVTTTARGTTVELYNLRLDDGYLVATGRDPANKVVIGEFWFKCVDAHSWVYNKWLSGWTSATAEAPTDSDADTIPFKTFEDLTDAEKALYKWLIANGVNEYWLLTGQTI